MKIKEKSMSFLEFAFGTNKDNEEALRIVKHFAGNIIPVCFVMSFFLIIHLLGSILFYSWIVTGTIVLAMAGALTWFEYEKKTPSPEAPSEDLTLPEHPLFPKAPEGSDLTED